MDIMVVFRKLVRYFLKTFITDHVKRKSEHSLFTTLAFLVLTVLADFA